MASAAPAPASVSFRHIYDATWAPRCGRGTHHDTPPFFDLGCGHVLCQSCVLLVGDECERCGWIPHPTLQAAFSKYTAVVDAIPSAAWTSVAHPRTPCLFNTCGLYLGASLAVKMAAVMINGTLSEATAAETIVAVFEAVSTAATQEQNVKAIVRDVYPTTFEIAEAQDYATGADTAVGAFEGCVTAWRADVAAAAVGANRRCLDGTMRAPSVQSDASMCVVLTKHFIHLTIQFDANTGGAYVFDPYGVGRGRLPYVAYFASDVDLWAHLASRLRNGAAPDLADCPPSATLRVHVIEPRPAPVPVVHPLHYSTARAVVPPREASNSNASSGTHTHDMPPPPQAPTGSPAGVVSSIVSVPAPAHVVLMPATSGFSAGLRAPSIDAAIAPIPRSASACSSSAPDDGLASCRGTPAAAPVPTPEAPISSSLSSSIAALRGVQEQLSRRAVDAAVPEPGYAAATGVAGATIAAGGDSSNYSVYTSSVGYTSSRGVQQPQAQQQCGHRHPQPRACPHLPVDTSFAEEVAIADGVDEIEGSLNIVDGADTIITRAALLRTSAAGVLPVPGAVRDCASVGDDENAASPDAPTSRGASASAAACVEVSLVECVLPAPVVAGCDVATAATASAIADPRYQTSSDPGPTTPRTSTAPHRRVLSPPLQPPPTAESRDQTAPPVVPPPPPSSAGGMPSGTLPAPPQYQHAPPPPAWAGPGFPVSGSGSIHGNTTARAASASVFRDASVGVAGAPDAYTPSLRAAGSPSRGASRSTSGAGWALGVAGRSYTSSRGASPPAPGTAAAPSARGGRGSSWSSCGHHPQHATDTRDRSPAMTDAASTVSASGVGASAAWPHPHRHEAVEEAEEKVVATGRTRYEHHGCPGVPHATTHPASRSPSMSAGLIGASVGGTCVGALGGTSTSTSPRTASPDVNVKATQPAAITPLHASRPAALRFTYRSASAPQRVSDGMPYVGAEVCDYARYDPDHAHAALSSTDGVHLSQEELPYTAAAVPTAVHPQHPSRLHAPAPVSTAAPVAGSIYCAGDFNAPHVSRISSYDEPPSHAVSDTSEAYAGVAHAHATPWSGGGVGMVPPPPSQDGAVPVFQHPAVAHSASVSVTCAECGQPSNPPSVAGRSARTFTSTSTAATQTSPPRLRGVAGAVLALPRAGPETAGGPSASTDGVAASAPTPSADVSTIPQAVPLLPRDVSSAPVYACPAPTAVAGMPPHTRRVSHSADIWGHPMAAAGRGGSSSGHTEGGRGLEGRATSVASSAHAHDVAPVSAPSRSSETASTPPVQVGAVAAVAAAATACPSSTAASASPPVVVVARTALPLPPPPSSSRVASEDASVRGASSTPSKSCANAGVGVGEQPATEQQPQQRPSAAHQEGSSAASPPSLTARAQDVNAADTTAAPAAASTGPQILRLPTPPASAAATAADDVARGTVRLVAEGACTAEVESGERSEGSHPCVRPSSPPTLSREAFAGLDVARDMLATMVANEEAEARTALQMHRLREEMEVRSEVARAAAAASAISIPREYTSPSRVAMPAATVAAPSTARTPVHPSLCSPLAAARGRHEAAVASDVSTPHLPHGAVATLLADVARLHDAVADGEAEARAALWEWKRCASSSLRCGAYLRKGMGAGSVATPVTPRVHTSIGSSAASHTMTSAVPPPPVSVDSRQQLGLSSPPTPAYATPYALLFRPLDSSAFRTPAGAVAGGDGGSLERERHRSASGSASTVVSKATTHAETARAGSTGTMAGEASTSPPRETARGFDTDCRALAQTPVECRVPDSGAAYSPPVVARHTVTPTAAAAAAAAAATRIPTASAHSHVSAASSSGPTSAASTLTAPAGPRRTSFLAPPHDVLVFARSPTVSEASQRHRPASESEVVAHRDGEQTQQTQVPPSAVAGAGSFPLTGPAAMSASASPAGMVSTSAAQAQRVPQGAAGVNHSRMAPTDIVSPRPVAMSPPPAVVAACRSLPSPVVVSRRSTTAASDAFAPGVANAAVDTLAVAQPASAPVEARGGVTEASSDEGRGVVRSETSAASSATSSAILSPKRKEKEAAFAVPGAYVLSPKRGDQAGGGEGGIFAPGRRPHTSGMVSPAPAASKLDGGAGSVTPPVSAIRGADRPASACSSVVSLAERLDLSALSDAPATATATAHAAFAGAALPSAPSVSAAAAHRVRATEVSNAEVADRRVLIDSEERARRTFVDYEAIKRNLAAARSRCLTSPRP